MSVFRPKAQKDQSYDPTSAELNEAIASFLREHTTSDAKEVREFLMKQNRTWRVPERRVRKFVKRQTQTPLTPRTGSMGTEDDDNKSVSSVRNRFKGMMKGAGRIFGSGKATPVVGEVPVFEIQTTKSLLPSINLAESTEEELLPPTPGDNTPKHEPVSQTTAADAPKVEIGTESTDAETSEIDEVKDRDLPAAESLIYKDDNDGKKDFPCVPCEGCIVL